MYTTKIATMRTDRLAAFDALRFCMIVCVVMLHAAMTYMEYMPAWWYVQDASRSLGFTVLVVLLDAFPMTTLFLLAGYFAPPSLARRGKRAFLRGKYRHVGVPWLLGVLLVAPLFAFASYRVLGFAGPFGAFLREGFFGPFYQQGHYWFLGVLVFFSTVYALFSDAFSSRRDCPPPVLLSAVWLLSTLAYYVSTKYLMPADLWQNVGYVFYFQPARIVGYACAFLFGVRAWNGGWLREGGWMPPLCPSAVIAFAAALALSAWKFLLAVRLPAGGNLILDALLYNTTSLSVTLFLVALFQRYQMRLERLARFWGPHAYAVYWQHQLILMPTQYLLLFVTVGIFWKWTFSVILTFFFGWIGSTFLLKRIPFLREIF